MKQIKPHQFTDDRFGICVKCGFPKAATAHFLGGDPQRMDEGDAIRERASEIRKDINDRANAVAAHFTIKDSGERKQFASGMVRDTTTGKIDFEKVMDGPMFTRWADHLTKGAVKYPDVKPGVANWTLAEGEEELARFRKSAFRHLVQWLRGDLDEDHAAAVFFNINGAEYVKGKLNAKD